MRKLATRLLRDMIAAKLVRDVSPAIPARIFQAEMATAAIGCREAAKIIYSKE